MPAYTPVLSLIRSPALVSLLVFRLLFSWSAFCCPRPSCEVAALADPPESRRLGEGSRRRLCCCGATTTEIPDEPRCHSRFWNIAATFCAECIVCTGGRIVPHLAGLRLPASSERASPATPAARAISARISALCSVSASVTRLGGRSACAHSWSWNTPHCCIVATCCSL